MKRKKPLSHQVVVIAGGSYGLGRAIARAAADRGARVVVGARTREALDATVGEVEATGSEGLAVQADVARQEDVEQLGAGAGLATMGLLAARSGRFPPRERT